MIRIALIGLLALVCSLPAAAQYPRSGDGVTGRRGQV